MKINIVKNIVLFLVGFCVYTTIEVLFRGFSYPVCGLMGGFAVVILDKINDHISWDIDLFFQALLGSALITFMELIIGTISNAIGIVTPMWDYSNMPLNYKGIICLPFSIAWMFLSVCAIFLADSINYYVFEDTCVPHYSLFYGLFTITFYKKRCDQ